MCNKTQACWVAPGTPSRCAAGGRPSWRLRARGQGHVVSHLILRGDLDGVASFYTIFTPLQKTPFFRSSRDTSFILGICSPYTRWSWWRLTQVIYTCNTRMDFISCPNPCTCTLTILINLHIPCWLIVLTFSMYSSYSMTSGQAVRISTKLHPSNGCVCASTPRLMLTSCVFISLVSHYIFLLSQHLLALWCAGSHSCIWGVARNEHVVPLQNPIHPKELAANSTTWANFFHRLLPFSPHFA